MLLGATCRVHWHNREIFDELANSNHGFVLSFWHENVLIIPWLLRNRGYTCMVSDSRDGEYIARIGLAFGNRIVRGSSSKGATRATRASLRVLKNSGVMSITPDGPRGPVHKLQSGVLWLAALGNAPILPFHIEVDRQWRFKSWDGQKIPKPFSTIHVSVAPPASVTKFELEDNFKDCKNHIESVMIDNTNCARISAGYKTLDQG